MAYKEAGLYGLDAPGGIAGDKDASHTTPNDEEPTNARHGKRRSRTSLIIVLWVRSIRDVSTDKRRVADIKASHRQDPRRKGYSNANLHRQDVRYTSGRREKECTAKEKCTASI
ncbi:hypothetical protein AC578_5646 [Pseudocercospora eumusae]|uniref:Uncharacterized protein n=1 Tax=Pseudocercospora eumusae TaxID=321146 RepID=A0A139HTF3_9PEZI|nr:hypothetical protein AC578_5646 [Pseudocercospora eumusae]